MKGLKRLPRMVSSRLCHRQPSDYTIGADSVVSFAAEDFDISFNQYHYS